MQEDSREGAGEPLAGGAKGSGLRGGVGVSLWLVASMSAETSTPPSCRSQSAEVGVLGFVLLAGSAKTSTAALEEADSPSSSLMLPSTLEEGEGLRSSGGGVDVADVSLVPNFATTPTAARRGHSAFRSIGVPAVAIRPGFA